MRRLVEIFERWFRRLIVYPFLRILFRNQTSNAPLELNRTGRILIFRFDRIGDMIVTTPILRALKKRNPRIRLGVIASRLNAEVLRKNPFVDNLYVLESNWFALAKQVLAIRNQHYDVVLNFVFNRTTSPGILANLIAPRGFKVGQGPDRYAFYFNRMVQIPRFEKHMVQSLAAMVEQTFGIRLAEDELSFELFIDDACRKSVDGYLAAKGLRRRSQTTGAGSPYVVFNLSAKDRERRISPDQAAAIAAHLSTRTGCRVIVLWAPGDKEMIDAVRERQEFANCFPFETTGRGPLGQLASIVAGAAAVLTPDTSIIHFACATKIPVLGFYTQLQGMKEWLPYNSAHEVVTAPAGQPASAIEIPLLIQKAESFVLSTLQQLSQDPANKT
jgi:ADP-heptose:LPS heptosyltransferase